MIVARVVSLLKFCGFLHFSTEQYDVMTNVLFFQNSLLTAIGLRCRPTLSAAKTTADIDDQHSRPTLSADNICPCVAGLIQTSIARPLCDSCDVIMTLICLCLRAK